MLGRMHRHGAVELLVVLPDGSKTLLPAVFTDAVAAAEPVAATVGSVEDLVHLAVVVESLMPPAVGAGRGGRYGHSDQGGLPCIRSVSWRSTSTTWRPDRRRRR